MLSEYPEYKEECSRALSYEGWSYFMLKDFRKSRMAFGKVISGYKSCADSYDYSMQIIKVLNQRDFH
jgi:hypothetical protein